MCVKNIHKDRKSTVKKEVLALLYTMRTMDFFLRFANRIIILVDAKAILYLCLCKEAAGILLRFSIELSKYEAKVFMSRAKIMKWPMF